MNRWFRWYEGTTEDGKFRLVARKSRVTIRDVLAVWAVILEDAADPTHPGECTRGFAYIESALDLADGQASAITLPMAEAGMVAIDGEHIAVLNWSKRQFRSDLDMTAAERQRRKRDRDKGADYAPVTRDIRTGHAALETDTEAEKKEPDATASGNAREAKHGRSKPRRRLPVDWEPGETHQQLASELGVELQLAAVEFREYWIGEGGLKADWDITFCRRLRAVAERNRGGAGGQRSHGNSPASLATSMRAVIASGQTES